MKKDSDAKLNDASQEKTGNLSAEGPNTRKISRKKEEVDALIDKFIAKQSQNCPGRAMSTLKKVDIKESVQNWIKIGINDRDPGQGIFGTKKIQEGHTGLQNFKFEISGKKWFLCRPY